MKLVADIVGVQVAIVSRSAAIMGLKNATGRIVKGIVINQNVGRRIAVVKSAHFKIPSLGTDRDISANRVKAIRNFYRWLIGSHQLTCILDEITLHEIM